MHPLGLVVKNQVWYLIVGTEAGQRTFRVSRVLSVERTGERVQRPEGFDLAAAWRAIVTSLDEQRAPATVRLRTDAENADILRYMFGTDWSRARSTRTVASRLKSAVTQS